MLCKMRSHETLSTEKEKHGGNKEKKKKARTVYNSNVTSLYIVLNCDI